MRRIGALASAIVLFAACAADRAVAEPRLSGRITDYDGQPVASADLDFFHPVTGAKLDPSPPGNPQSDKTDATGFYSMLVSSGLYRVRYQPPPTRADLALVTYFNVLIQADTTLDVQLPRGYAIAGQVTSPSGFGVTAVDLDVLNEATGERFSPPGDLTNFLGLYQLTVAAATYSVFFTPPVSTHLVPVVLPHVTVNADVTLDVRLSAGFILRGEVRDPSGALVPGVDLDFDDSATHARVFTPNDATDASGRFALTLAGGTYDVGFTPPVGVEAAGVLLRTVSVTADATLPPVQFTRGSRVAFVVHSPFGVALAGAHINVIDDASGATFPTIDAATGTDGASALRVPPGRYRFVVVPPANAGLDTLRSVAIDVGTDTTIALDYPRGAAVTVHVALHVAGAPHGGTIAVWTAPRSGVPLVTTTADAAGRTSVALSPGFYDFAIAPEPGVDPDSVLLERVFVAADTTLDVVFTPDAASDVMSVAVTSRNPSRGRAFLRLVLPPAEAADIFIVDAGGRVIRRDSFAPRPAGANVTTWTWDGLRDDAQLASGGGYYAVLVSAHARASARLVRLP